MKMYFFHKCKYLTFYCCVGFSSAFCREHSLQEKDKIIFEVDDEHTWQHFWVIIMKII